MAIPALERVTNDRTLAATVAVHAAATMAMVWVLLDRRTDSVTKTT